MMAKRLRYIPMALDQRCRIIRANILAAGLYGGKFVKANKGAMAKLRTAIVDMTSTRTARRSPMGTC